jgi:hypothetical protein
MEINMLINNNNQTSDTQNKQQEHANLVNTLYHGHGINKVLKLASKEGSEVTVNNNLVTISHGNESVTVDLHKITTSRTLKLFKQPSQEDAFKKKLAGLANKILLAKEKPSILNKKVRQKIESKLKNFGLTKEEFVHLERYYTNNKERLDSLTEPTYFHRRETGLSRSLVYVPEDPKKGMYILLQTHGGVGEIGVGSYNVATLAIHLDTGNRKVFRSGLAEDIRQGEIEANKATAALPEFFAAGIPVSYTGNWVNRQRKTNMSIEKKRRLPRKENVAKVGFIMDYLKGGELSDILFKGELEFKQQVGIALEYTKCLEKFHELGFVHFDQKPENTFMTKNLGVRLADFGFAVKKGTSLQKLCGTPGFIAPEFMQAYLHRKSYVADPAVDIWSLGCLLAELFNGNEWYNTNGQSSGDDKLLLDNDMLEDLKAKVFPNMRFEGFPVDHILDSCLQHHPLDRPSASEIAIQLEQIYDNIT